MGSKTCIGGNDRTVPTYTNYWWEYLKITKSQSSAVVAWLGFLKVRFIFSNSYAGIDFSDQIHIQNRADREHGWNSWTWFHVSCQWVYESLMTLHWVQVTTVCSDHSELAALYMMTYNKRGSLTVFLHLKNTAWFQSMPWNPELYSIKPPFVSFAAVGWNENK